MRQGLQIGCVVDETRLEFGRGDFLVRGVVGADQRSGAIAVGDNVAGRAHRPVPGPRRRLGRRGPAGPPDRRRGRRRPPLHLQRPGPAALRRGRPRRRRHRPAPRSAAPRRLLLRRRARPRRGPQLPPRLHGQPRPVHLLITSLRGCLATLPGGSHGEGERPGGHPARPPVGWLVEPSERDKARMANDLEIRAINVIRGLAMDAVQKANSGHPGTAMALAPLANVLLTRIMRYDAGDPEWPDRDRFILSAGHASMLLYSMLYLAGFGLSLDDLKDFRQWGSRTPGHPEYGHAPGIEVTTGPLGQGFANGVGMAIAEANLRARFGADVCDHRIFAVCSDGDLSEGISHEAGSLAGHLGLGRLVYVYDDNHITIDGTTEIALSDDAGKRFEAYGWHVVQAGEVAEDPDALEAALREGMAEEERPSLIILRSHIGFPSPNFTDTPKAHGEPLGAEEIARVKEILGMPAEDFWVPDDVLDHYRQAGRRGAAEREAWAGRLEQLRARTARTGRGVRGLSGRAGPGRLGAEAAVVAGRGVDRHPGRLRRRPQRHRRPRARPDRRRRRPHRQHRHEAVGLRRVLARGPQGPPALLRGPGARHGVGHERDGPPRRGPPLRRDLPDLLRLHAGRRPAGGAGAGPHGLRLVARLGRPRRGRADPPADRASRLAAGHPGPAGDPTGRRQRDVAVLAGPHQFRRAERLHPLPPEAAGPRGHDRAGRGRCRPGRLRPRRRARRPRRRPHRDGL